MTHWTSFRSSAARDLEHLSLPVRNEERRLHPTRSVNAYFAVLLWRFFLRSDITTDSNFHVHTSCRLFSLWYELTLPHSRGRWINR